MNSMTLTMVRRVRARRAARRELHETRCWLEDARAELVEVLGATAWGRMYGWSRLAGLSASAGAWAAEAGHAGQAAEWAQAGLLLGVLECDQRARSARTASAEQAFGAVRAEEVAALSPTAREWAAWRRLAQAGPDGGMVAAVCCQELAELMQARGLPVWPLWDAVEVYTRLYEGAYAPQAVRARQAAQDADTAVALVAAPRVAARIARTGGAS